MNRMTDFQLRILERVEIKCSDVEALLDDYVEQELPPTLKSRLDAHVASCEECQEGVHQYEQVISLAREIGERRITPPGVRSRLRKALNAELGIDLPVTE